MFKKNGIAFVLQVLLIFLFAYSSLTSKDLTDEEKTENRGIERFLSDYFTNDLQINFVVVKIDEDVVAISGTPDFSDKDKATGQIILAIAGAGVAAPQKKSIIFTVQIMGMPIGFIEVPARKAMLVSEGKISEKDFISSFITTRLPIPFDFPGDLLAPIIRSDEIWENSSVFICDAVKIGELLKVNVDEFLPEFLQAVYVETNPIDGSLSPVAAAIDFENEKDAIDFFDLNSNQSLNKKMYRIGTIVYIIKGPDPVLEKSIIVLESKTEKKTAEMNDTIIKNTPENKELKLNRKISSTKYFIVGAGFFFLIIIIIIIIILSGKSSRRRYID